MENGIVNNECEFANGGVFWPLLTIWPRTNQRIKDESILKICYDMESFWKFGHKINRFVNRKLIFQKFKNQKPGSVIFFLNLTNYQLPS